MQTFDYIIVGAGSAGCILANRLSEDPNVSVCLLEAGGRDTNPYIHVPAGFIKTFYDPSVNWNYSMEPGDWTGGRRIHAPRGKTLGGSSAINGHVYNRGQRYDFDTWAQLTRGRSSATKGGATAMCCRISGAPKNAMWRAEMRIGATKDTSM